MPRKPKAHPTSNTAAAQELRSLVERKERLLADLDFVKSDIKELGHEIKSRGFDLKVIDRIIAERAETDEDRRLRKERDAILDVYRAALGMLDGTPLGDSARERLSGQKPDEPTGEPVEAASTLGPEEMAAAKEAGRQACREGKKVIENPYMAGDPRRAAWDEGWCSEAGSDGMDIPAAFRRAEKPKKPKAEKPEGGEDDDGGEGGE